MMDIFEFTFLVITGFCGMELVSYLTHRFLFHGLLWSVHESHHKHTHGWFELNDLFSLFFTAISVGLILWGVSDPIESVSFALGAGIALYGMLYFIIHDLFAHKRFVPFKSNNKVMKLIRKAHQRHHQSVDQAGQEPYGLFLFPYNKYKNDN